jgi:hypothetical protein
MAFNDFVELELPKRPFTAGDGLPGQLLARSGNPLAPRELVWAYAADLLGAGGANAVPKVDLPCVVATSGHRAMCGTGDGHVRYASSADVADANAVIGISLHAADAGAMVSIQYAGTLVEPTWNWLPQLPIFCGVAGVLTQTPPAAGFCLILGVATAPTAIAVSIKQPVIII